MSKGESLFERRRRRVRTKLQSQRSGRVRLSVHRSGKHIYAQVIDDVKGVTASTLDKAFAGKTGANVDAAKTVGQLIAERSKAAGVSEVVFDRGGYLYHGRVKALAEAAREAGLTF